MNDPLGEALARWEGWEQGEPFDPGTLDQLLAAARNWHTLTTAPQLWWCKFERRADEYRQPFCYLPTSGNHDNCGPAVLVDALTDTAEPDDDLPDVKSRWYANTTEPE